MAEFIELILLVAILVIVFGARRSGAVGSSIGRALTRGQRSDRSDLAASTATPTPLEGGETANDET